MPTVPEFLDDTVVDPIVFGVVNGDRAAWVQLVVLVQPWVDRCVPVHRRMRQARLGGHEDDVRDVFLAVIERIERDDFRSLRQYLERKASDIPDVRAAQLCELPELSFARWLSGLIDFAIRDHVRSRYGRRARMAPDASGYVPVAAKLTKRDLHSWAEHPTLSKVDGFGSAYSAMSRVLTARSIMHYAAEEFDAKEFLLYEKFLQCASFDELATEFSLDGPDAARAVVRKLTERLRVRFRSV